MQAVVAVVQGQLELAVLAEMVAVAQEQMAQMFQ
jgi:hypothetical protein